MQISPKYHLTKISIYHHLFLLQVNPNIVAYPSPTTFSMISLDVVSSLRRSQNILVQVDQILTIVDVLSVDEYKISYSNLMPLHSPSFAVGHYKS